MYQNFKLYGTWVILRECATYSRTDSGKSWKRKPDEVRREVIDADFYSNFIVSIDWFNSWGDGAYCRGERNYTIAGYIPTKVTTVSPHRATKQVDTFVFIPRGNLMENAGRRETRIVSNAETWDIEGGRGHRLITFDTGNESATYEDGTNNWIN